MGSFVPASSAHIGIVTKLFSRVGASDDLARGHSTFMVEMVETAAILNQADERSLVILDEIGRGTATHDGLSIAWATLEHLHEQNRCRALFATHYHELASLSKKMNGITNATVSVKEYKEEIIFLYEVILGFADRSYGVQVAKLAGMPRSVLMRANQVLSALNSTDQKNTPNTRKILETLPLFEKLMTNNQLAKKITSEIETELKNTDPDRMTPKEALDLIYKLKDMILN
jgi:DNA mismatch repair protein MutS